MSQAMTWLLAHQGGWDEALLFAGPLVLAFLAISAIERHGKRRQRELMERGELPEKDVDDHFLDDAEFDHGASGSQNNTP
jgi:hypothetical protein